MYMCCAGFYLDLYSRPSEKRGGAWMDSCVDRSTADGHVRLPVAYLVCNTAPPVDGGPALMTWGEVVTLFHEFGHGLWVCGVVRVQVGVGGVCFPLSPLNKRQCGRPAAHADDRRLQ